MNDLLSDFARRCMSLRRQIEMMDNGDLTSAERTLQRPAWTDTTKASRSRAASHLANYERLIARYSPLA